jgi:NAD-dependent DNA ligase
MTQQEKYNSGRNMTKAMQTLLGICRGLTADNHLNDDEIGFLSTWILDNQEVGNEWPGSVIRERIQHVMADGVISEEEREQLLDTLKSISGDEFKETGSAEAAPVIFPTEEVDIQVEGSTFCLTGKFIFGPRSSVERVIESKGGSISSSITQKTDYLIIGTLSSPDWLHANHGLKIQKAVEMKNSGGKISIITEKAWLDAVS